MESASIILNIPEHFKGVILLFQFFQPPDALFFIALSVIILLLFLAGLLSASEITFFSLKETALNKIKESNHKTDKLIVRLMQSPRELLSTILISSTLVNIAIVVLYTITVNRYFGQSSFISLFFQIILLTIVLVILGQLTPRIHASHSKLPLTKYMAYPLLILMRILMPVSRMMISASSQIEMRIKKHRQSISAEDLRHAIKLTSEQSKNTEEKKILSRIVNFNNVYVRQIMTSRLDVVALEHNLTFHDLLKDINTNKFSRVPVYKDNSDNITGILYIKDLLPFFNKPDDFKWQELLRKPYFIPETKMIDDLLREFQTKKVHLAVVVDEYGGFSGIITLEDILEEIVGEITDEFDDAGSDFRKVDDQTFIFDAKIQLTELIKILNLSDDYFEDIKGESETLGGLLTEIKGKIPLKNDRFAIGELNFTVEESDNKRIKSVKIELKPVEPES